MVAVLMMTLCVSTFASGNVLKGEEAREPDTTNIVGTWVFNDIINITESRTFDINFISAGNLYNTLIATKFSGFNTIKYGNENESLEVYDSYDVYWYPDIYKTITITDDNYSEQTISATLTFLNTNATKLGNSTGTVGILDVASEIPSFMTTGLTTVTALFYTNGNLTFLGYLAIASLAISVCFLVISIIRNFLHFRG